MMFYEVLFNLFTLLRVLTYLHNFLRQTDGQTDGRTDRGIPVDLLV
jgi:hypothetical protein